MKCKNCEIRKEIIKIYAGYEYSIYFEKTDLKRLEKLEQMLEKGE